MTKNEQLAILEHHFMSCVRFWECELNMDTDLDKEPYIRAIYEIPIMDPTRINGESFDKDIRESFIRYRFMDCYGRDWERYYEQMRPKMKNVN